MMTKTEDIYRLLGADPKKGRIPVLLPIPAKQKGPRVAAWQEKSAADMARPDWLAQLDAHENTGVSLGPVSGGLATIDVDNEDFVELILELNPRLRGALRTRGAKGCQIWMWLVEDAKMIALGLPSYPPARYNINHRTRVVERSTVGGSTTVPFVVCEWRGGGCQSVVRGIHPDGHAYTVLVDAPPLEYRFRDIVWPDCVDLPWEAANATALSNLLGSPFAKTQDGLVMCDHFWAGRFALKHDILTDAEAESFFMYTAATGAWEPRTRAEVTAKVSRDLMGMSRNPGFEVLEGNGCRSAGRVGSVVTYLEGETTKRGAFEREPGIIHFANGMIDVREESPRLMPFAPEYMSRNRLPWDYDPSAKCPNFEEILLGTALDSDDILTLQKCFGSILLGHNLLQRIVILTGTANGGKSQIADVFQRIVGMHNVANLRTEMLGERFEMSAFVGKTLIAGADVAGDFLRQKQVGKLKSLTGGDNLEAETKGGGFRQIKGSFNVMVTCNSRLTVKMEDDADAWRRRLVIIAFVKPPPVKPIQQLSDKLLLGSKELGWAPEASGIINWGLRGAVALLKDSAIHGKVLMSKRQLQRVDDLLAESESVRHFVQEAVVKSEKEMAESMTTEELLQEYQGFCADRSWAAIPDSQFLHQLGDWMLRTHSVTMSNDLRREGHDGKTKTKRGYRHVMLTAGPREE